LAPASPPRTPSSRLSDQPYLLLSLTSLFWAGNAIVGRFAAGHIAPVTFSFIRWGIAFLIVLPFAWRHVVADWPTIRARLGVMVLLSVCGIGAFNTLQYWSLEYTTALNILLLQSSGPLFVAVWSLVVSGVRLTAAQAAGIVVSMIGVVVILLHGDLTALAGIELNKGDIIFTVALAIFGLYSALSSRRPAIHDLSFLAFTFGCGALCLVPLFVWELFARPVMQVDAQNLLSLAYVAIFPSTLAYLCYNRGVQLIGANRGAVLSHDSGIRFGDGDLLPRRKPAAVSPVRLWAGADRRVRRGAKAQDYLRRRPENSGSGGNALPSETEHFRDFVVI
jgi:drug/metabolite transporter (DMT)-like permease